MDKSKRWKIKPNLVDELYEEWNNGSIIYLLFNIASNQSELRKVSIRQRYII